MGSRASHTTIFLSDTISNMSLQHEFILGFNSGFAFVACVLVYAAVYYSHYIWSPAEEEKGDTQDLGKMVVHMPGVEGWHAIEDLEFVYITVLEEEEDLHRLDDSISV